MVFEVYFSDYLKQFNEMKPERWNYHLGCVLLGAEYLYEITGREMYLTPILNFGKDYVDHKGIIKGFRAEEHNVDLMASGRALPERDPLHHGGVESAAKNKFRQLLA